MKGLISSVFLAATAWIFCLGDGLYNRLCKPEKLLLQFILLV